jgi:hypothetical protein
MGYVPSAPAAIAAIVARFRTAAALGTAEVRDGPSIANRAATEVLAAGWTGGDDSTDADGNFTHEGLGAADRESYSVHCAASVMNGDGDIAAARARAFALASSAMESVAAEHTLGGAVMRAMPGGWSLRQQLTDADGVITTVFFDIDIDAFTGR